MPIDFPNSSSNGDTYSAGGKNWLYNGTAWVMQGVVSQIADGSISTTQLASNAVHSVNIAPGAVTAAKLGNDISLTPADGSITQAKLSQNISAVTICTSTTRPASPFTGQTIFETDTNRMKVWLGSAWSIGTTHSTTNGLTEEGAAPHANYLVSTLGYTTNGYYWLKPTGTNLARRVWCDLQNSGGGWMLMSFTGVNNTTGSHVIDTYSGSSFNMDSSATAINSTSPAAGAAGNLGQTFINNMVVSGRQKAVALFRIHDGGTTWKNWYFPTNANSSWLTLTSRQGGGATASNQANTWLLTAYSSYTDDAGNSGAGTVGGSTYAYNNETWPSYPGNISVGLSDNWGYSIASTFPGGFAQYNSCHSNGWNRAGSFWLKVSG